MNKVRRFPLSQAVFGVTKSAVLVRWGRIRCWRAWRLDALRSIRWARERFSRACSSPASALGALLGLAVGSVGVGIAIGAVIGIPAAIVSVYLRYKDAF